MAFCFEEIKAQNNHLALSTKIQKYLEPTTCSKKISVPLPWKVFWFESPPPLWKFQFSPILLPFENPYPLIISIDLPWGGSGYFVELHNVIFFQLACMLYSIAISTFSEDFWLFLEISKDFSTTSEHCRRVLINKMFLRLSNLAVQCVKLTQTWIMMLIFWIIFAKNELIFNRF